MDEVIVRPADLHDREALGLLYHEFHEFHVRGVPDRLRSLGDPNTYDRTDLYTRIEEIIEADDSALFVSEVGEQVVGFAEVYIRQDELNPARVTHRYALLQSLMVRDEFRKHGIGIRLVEVAEKWAMEKNATEMRVDIWEFPDGPLEFYESIGYRTLRRTLINTVGREPRTPGNRM